MDIPVPYAKEPAKVHLVLWLERLEPDEMLPVGIGKSILGTEIGFGVKPVQFPGVPTLPLGTGSAPRRAR